MRKNMRHKIGFTLVELLAVIVILAIILVIAVPKITSIIESVKLGSIESTAKLILNSGKKLYTNEMMLGNNKKIKCDDVVKLSDNDYGICSLKFDATGNATIELYGKESGKFNNYICTGNEETLSCEKNTTCYNFKKIKDLNINYDTCVSVLTEYGLDDVEDLCSIREDSQGYTLMDYVLYDTEWFVENNVINPSYETVCFQPTYLGTNSCIKEDDLPIESTYINGQYKYKYSYFNNGWSVEVLDQASTEPITTDLCSSVNGRPITNMAFMFSESQATSIDLSSFDTSNVTDMSDMFYYSQATSLDLSSFDTSNVTDMAFMFIGSQATSLDLSSFDTSNVTDMGYMFMGSQATSLDLSSFDTSNVTNMNWMFSGSQATVGYAKTIADANRLNSSSSKPSALTFVVK